MTIEVGLDGRHALVVGSGGIVGDAIAAALARNGAAVQSSGSGPANVSPDILVVLAIDPAIDAGKAETILRDISGGMPQGSRIVVVASALGLVAVREAAAESVRAAGLLALTRAFAMEFAARRIALNAVAVGPIEDEAGLSARMISHVPIARSARPEEVADAVLFLADPENSYMTGHVLTVDGGWTAGFARDF